MQKKVLWKTNHPSESYKKIVFHIMIFRLRSTLKPFVTTNICDKNEDLWSKTSSMEKYQWNCKIWTIYCNSLNFTLFVNLADYYVKVTKKVEVTFWLFTKIFRLYMPYIERRESIFMNSEIVSSVFYAHSFQSQLWLQIVISKRRNFIQRYLTWYLMNITNITNSYRIYLQYLSGCEIDWEPAHRYFRPGNRRRWIHWDCC